MIGGDAGLNVLACLFTFKTRSVSINGFVVFFGNSNLGHHFGIFINHPRVVHHFGHVVDFGSGKQCFHGINTKYSPRTFKTCGRNTAWCPEIKLKRNFFAVLDHKINAFDA